MPSRSTSTLLCLLVLGLTVPAWADPGRQTPAEAPAKKPRSHAAGDETPSPEDKTATPAKKDGREGPVADPFAVDASLRRLLEGKRDGFEPLNEQPPLPPMHLRGVLEIRGRKPVATVEIEGVGTFLAREGERILFTVQGRVVPRSVTEARATGARPAANASLRSIAIALLVREVGPEAVVVEVGSPGETLVIR